MCSMVFLSQPLSGQGDTRSPFQIPDGLKERLREITLERKDIESIQLPQLTTEGLVWGGRYPQVIINGRVLRIGDSIEGAMVKDINRKGVVLIYKGVEFTLGIEGKGGMEK